MTRFATGGDLLDARTLVRNAVASAAAAIILLSVTRMFTPKLHAEEPWGWSSPPPARALVSHKTRICSESVSLSERTNVLARKNQSRPSLRTDIRRALLLSVCERDVSHSALHVFASQVY